MTTKEAKIAALKARVDMQMTCLDMLTKSSGDILKIRPDKVSMTEKTCLEDLQARADAAFTKIQSTLEELTILVPGDAQELLTGIGEKYLAMKTKTSSFLGAIPTTVSPISPKSGQKVKSVDVLRPPPLTSAFSASELKTWLEQAKAYYVASNLKMLDLPSQRQYILSLLSHELQCIMAEIEKSSPIFCDQETPGQDGKAPPSIETLLISYWRIIYPICQRKIDLLQVKQFTPTETFSAYFARFKNLVEVADFYTTSSDDLAKYLLIGGIKNNELRAELIKKDHLDPKATLDQMKQVGLLYDLNVATAKCLAPLPNPPSLLGKEQELPTPKRTPKEAQKVSVCFRCNVDHLGKECEFKNARCERCRKLGHSSSACKSKNLEKGEKSDDSSEDEQGHISAIFAHSHVKKTTL